MIEKNNTSSLHFFCDIMGTFSQISDKPEEIKSFIENLSSLGKKHNCNNIYLEFITSDKLELLNEYLKIIKPYTNDSSVKLGTQFCEDGYFSATDSKISPYTTNQNPFNKSFVITEFLSNNSNLSQNDYVVLADDTKLNCVLLEYLWNRLNFNNEQLTILNPTHQHNINKCLKEYLTNGISFIKTDKGKFPSEK